MKAITNISIFLLIFFASQKISADTHYVSLSGSNIFPFTTWINASTNIQAAVDAAISGDIVLVTNGTYYPVSQIFITNNIIVKSINGAEKTIVDGGFPAQTNRCFYLNNSNPTIIGFSIINSYSGGIYCNSGGVVQNCYISGNSAFKGGGIYCHYGGTVRNCIIFNNSASEIGGGVYCAVNGTIQNCTITGNSASERGGGVFCRGKIQNCIIYYNFALVMPNYYIKYDYSTFEYNCTTPLPNGSGNISDIPNLLDSGHIASNSPCVGAGSTNYSSGVDIDGDIWENPPAIGCDQPTTNPATGKLFVSLFTNHKKFTTGYSNYFHSSIIDRATYNCWSFDDGTSITNILGCYHSWNSTGNYKVILTAYNETYFNGVSDTVIVEVIQKQIHYVNKNNLSPVVPYISWETAATNIQNAVDSAINIGDMVLVTNGTYYPSSQITVSNEITIKSINGALFTIIDGKGTNRCLYLTKTNPTIDGFTITNGYAFGDYPHKNGGGVFCNYGGTVQNCIISGNLAVSLGGGVHCYFGGMIKNCVVSGNSAEQGGGVNCYYNGSIQNSNINGNSAERGGGAFFFYGGIVQNCTINKNVALSTFHGGGGVICGSGSSVQNCTISENSASNEGGGVLCQYGFVQNCTISGNSASNEGGGVHYLGGTMENSILWNNTDKEISGWISINRYNCIENWTNLINGIITNNPQFVSASNFHLLSTSPCINAGTNLPYVYTTTDLDGNPRLFGDKVNMGAYEFVPEPFLIVNCYLLFIIYYLKKKIC